MEMNSLVDVLMGMVLAGGGWFCHSQNQEMKRIQILVNKTREEYVSKIDSKTEMDRIYSALDRIEAKLDNMAK
tara:strand:- start:120 stop:338 length:219 start_codon:yes stop_codon:yes gene_type:complete